MPRKTDYPIPHDEQDRLKALKELNLLDTGPEAGFDRLTSMAKDIFGCNITLVSLIDQERQWFKSACGLDTPQTDRDVAFCNYTILDDEIFEVVDAHKDMRFKDNPLVTGEPYIRYYAGAPIFSSGKRIATFCVIDSQPRSAMSERERRILYNLAEMTSREIEVRTLVRRSLAAISQSMSLG